MVDAACQCSLRVPSADSCFQAGSGATSHVTRAVNTAQQTHQDKPAQQTHPRTTTQPSRPTRTTRLPTRPTSHQDNKTAQQTHQDAAVMTTRVESVSRMTETDVRLVDVPEIDYFTSKLTLNSPMDQLNSC